MQQTAKTIVFKLIDKIILAVILIVTIIFVIKTSGKKVNVDPHPDFGKLLEGVQKKRDKARHPETELPKDVIAATVSGLKAPKQVIIPPGDIFVPLKTAQKAGPAESQFSFVWTKDSEPQPQEHKLLNPIQQLLMTIADGTKVAVENIADRPDTIIIKPLEPLNPLKPVDELSTKIEFQKDGKVVEIIHIVGKFKGQPVTEPPTPPRNVLVEAGQGKVDISFHTSKIEHGIITEYRILKKEADGEMKHVLTIPAQPPGDEPKEEDIDIKTKLPDGTAGPVIKLKGEKYSLVDRDVVGDTPYAYAIEVMAIDSEKKPISTKTEEEKVTVEERFKIVFQLPVSPLAGMEPEAQVEISVFYQPDPAEPGIWVSKKFNVRKGMPIGWTADLNLPGKRLKAVDFSTGYRVLDIIADEPRIKSTMDIREKGEVIGQREIEGKRHRLLLINDRGSIKVLWHEIN